MYNIALVSIKAQKWNLMKEEHAQPIFHAQSNDHRLNKHKNKQKIKQLIHKIPSSTF
jgi:hypothetical protein